MTAYRLVGAPVMNARKRDSCGAMPSSITSQALTLVRRRTMVRPASLWPRT